MLVVLVGFATGTLFGYKGGVILVQGLPFSNNLTQYDDFVPGSLFDPDGMDPFSFTVDDFDVEWLTSGMARGFDAELRYTEAPGDPEKSYDLRVNHPLKIGGTELFLIGHGYAPVVTVRDGDGNVAASGPVPFLPMGPDLFSFGVIKAPDAKPGQIGLEGYFYPTFANVGRHAGQPRRQGCQPAALAQRLHRRPQPRLRCVAVGLHPRQVEGDRRAGQKTASRSASAWRRETPSSCRTGWAASPSTGSSPGSGSRSARRRARTSRCWGSCWRCSG